MIRVPAMPSPAQSLKMDRLPPSPSVSVEVLPQLAFAATSTYLSQMESSKRAIHELHHHAVAADLPKFL